MSTRLPVEDHALDRTSSDDSPLDDKAKLPLDLSLAAPQEVAGSNGLSALWYSWRGPARDLDAIATQPSVFDDPVALEAYRPPPEFENAHRFDPDARWTYREEQVCSTSFLGRKFRTHFQRIVRKIDLRIAFWACIMFFALDLDRGNISQANADNFLDDIGITTNDFNLGSTLFRVAFLTAGQCCLVFVYPGTHTQFRVTLAIGIETYWSRCVDSNTGSCLSRRDVHLNN